MPRPLVLLVDDDPAVRASIAFALEVEGFEVESFATAEAALIHGPDRAAVCAVLDHSLPEMDGLALLARLRMHAKGLPAIIIASRASKQVRRQVALMDAILVEKPLLSDAMVEAIRSLATSSSSTTVLNGN